MARASAGDEAAWAKLLCAHQDKLSLIVSFRMDRRLRGRVDPGDVMQDAFIEATERRNEFFQQSSQPLFLWLRWMVRNTLLVLHRHHLGAQMRDARRELPYAGGPAHVDGGDNTRAALVAELTCGATGPGTAVANAEVAARVDEALGKMDPTDREVVALRHFEQLTNAEAAQVLGIQERAAAKRYLRALERLREMLADTPGGLTELRP
jgi:RNA polymerase sigma-70 factor, ECF subfamily